MVGSSLRYCKLEGYASLAERLQRQVLRRTTRLNKKNPKVYHCLLARTPAYRDHNEDEDYRELENSHCRGSS